MIHGAEVLRSLMLQSFDIPFKMPLMQIISQLN